MTLDEQNIEKIAQTFFSSSENTKTSEKEFLQILYKSEFVRKILMKSLANFTDVLEAEDIDIYKTDVVLIAFNQSLKNYDTVQGRFINYFSFVLKRTAIQYLNKQKDESLKKRKKEISLNTPIGNDDEGSHSIGDTLEDERINTEKDIIEKSQLEKVNEIRTKILKAIDGFYQSTKAGQKNKSGVYTYFVLELLKGLSDSELEEAIEKYSFLTPHKDSIKKVIIDMKTSDEIPTQKDFADFVGIQKNRFSEMIEQLSEELRKNSELKNIL